MKVSAGTTKDPGLSGFRPDGYYDGVAYKFGPDGSIDAIVSGRVVRFDDFDAFVRPNLPRRGRKWLTVSLLVFYAIACCVSFFFVQRYYSYLGVTGYDPELIPKAIAATLPLAALSLLFAVGRVTFGYALSFYLFTTLLEYSWLTTFSTFHYNKGLAALSIFFSAIAFFIPAIFVTPKIPRPPELSESALSRLLFGIMAVSGLILVWASTYHFRVIGIQDIYNYRSEIELPGVLRYGVGITTGALLPFAFTLFVFRRNWSAAAGAAVLLLLFYPVSLLKLTLLAPAWLVFLTILSLVVEIRAMVILSLLLPMLAGLATVVFIELGLLDYHQMNFIFSIANFRMLAVPAFSLDIYNDFFSRNPFTYFCQISWLKPYVSCPYSEPLAVILAKAYGIGTLNASLFATEGIASVGLILAPLAALACGLVVAFGNALSSHLPPRFVIISSGIVLQSFLNVPLTTMLLTNGAGALFLLWYLTPASIFRASVATGNQMQG